MRTLIRLLRSRVTIAVFAILLQLFVLGAVVLFLNRHMTWFYGVMILLSALIVLSILNDKSNPSYKIAWIIPLMLFPVFGAVFYVLFGRRRQSRRERETIEVVKKRVADCMLVCPERDERLFRHDLSAAAQSGYIRKHSFISPFRDNKTTYYPLGEQFFEALRQDLAKAQKYIFMEYFIIEEGIMWDAILEVLAERARAGVKVRVMYDAFGCLMTLPPNYHEKLRSMGIETAVFNPIKPVMSLRYNTRDHRKITVIDGIVGYTGGCNLADEYINAFVKHGHWKDNAIRIEGGAVWGLAVMFLSLWDFLVGIDEKYAAYMPDNLLSEPQTADSTSPANIVQPFTDDPLDGEPVGASIYMNMINRAQRYVYAKSPYLIIDNEMYTALSLAAKSGVDVRIIMPGVPDKTYVHSTSRSYYLMLIESGVRIYEYTAGFVHEKVFVSDDRYGVVGTVNLDYRSLYLHYECGVWLYETDSIRAMKEDFDAMFPLCREVTLADCRDVPRRVRLFRAIMRLIAPLM